MTPIDDLTTRGCPAQKGMLGGVSFRVTGRLKQCPLRYVPAGQGAAPWLLWLPRALPGPLRLVASQLGTGEAHGGWLPGLGRRRAIPRPPKQGGRFLHSALSPSQSSASCATYPPGEGAARWPAGLCVGRSKSSSAAMKLAALKTMRSASSLDVLTFRVNGQMNVSIRWPKE